MMRYLLLAAVAVVCSGCEDLGLRPAEPAGRYEFATDERGRTLRLDTVTGDVTEVDGFRAPARQTPRPGAAPARPAPAARPQATPPEPAPEPAPDAAPDVAPAPEPEAAPEPAPAPAATDAPAASNQCVLGDLVPGDRLVVADSAQVFVRPGGQEPIVALPGGTSVRFALADGEWLLVRFDDPQWGERAGYAHCAGLTANGVN